MNRADILSLARTEMNKHGLVNWTVKFIKSKTVAGLCWTVRWNADPLYSLGRIELSSDYFDVFSDYDILDTILHEIAHALTPDIKTKYQSGQRKGQTRRIVHGAEWKAIAKRIGCSGMRCVRQEAARPEGRYKGICPNGHESFRHRMTWQAKHNTSCAQCDPKKYRSEFMFDWYDNGVLIHSQKRVLDSNNLMDTQIEQLKKILQEA